MEKHVRSLVMQRLAVCAGEHQRLPTDASDVVLLQRTDGQEVAMTHLKLPPLHLHKPTTRHHLNPHTLDTGGRGGGNKTGRGLGRFSPCSLMEHRIILYPTHTRYVRYASARGLPRQLRGASRVQRCFSNPRHSCPHCCCTIDPRVWNLASGIERHVVGKSTCVQL